MIEASVARRYARALFDLAAQEAGAAEQVGRELAALSVYFEESAEARAVLLSPSVPDQRRHDAVAALGKNGLHALTTRFLHLLVERQRLAGLSGIVRSYRDLLDRHLGRVRATVTAPAPLAQGEVEKVRAALAQATRKEVLLSTQVDPALLGGVVAEVDGRVYDGSLRTQLERMRDELKAAPL